MSDKITTQNGKVLYAQEIIKSRVLWVALISFFALVCKEFFGVSVSNELADSALNLVLIAVSLLGIVNSPSVQGDLAQGGLKD